MRLAGQRFYPIQVAEKGYVHFRLEITAPGVTAPCPATTMPSSSPPRSSARVAVAGADPPRRRSVRRLLEAAAEALPDEAGRLTRAARGRDPARAEAAIDRICDPSYGRALRALLRDTVSPT